jgi:hypothetical protein
MADPTIKRGPSNEVPALGYDPTTKHAMVPLQAVSATQDATTGQWYGVLAASISQPTSATGTLTSVPAATGNTQILAANTSRKAAYFYNDSTAVMYLAFNATASTSSYTVQVPASGFFEMPTSPVYTGQINAVWSAANGNARVTELS